MTVGGRSTSPLHWFFIINQPSLAKSINFPCKNKPIQKAIAIAIAGIMFVWF